MSLRQEIHDRLWSAFQRWQGLRLAGETKRELKLRGLRECGDPNRYTRDLLFTGNTLRSYEAVLKDFVDHAVREHGARRLEDIGKQPFRSYMDRAIERGLAVKTLHRYRSALAKFGALTGQTKSFAALSEKYGWRIRELGRAGALAAPTRQTPSRDVLDRAVAVLKAWDARHFARTDEPRAYHLAARLQLETAARSISATIRVTTSSMRPDNRIALIGKGGKEQIFALSPDLHRTLSLWFAHRLGPLAHQKGYQSAYARAIKVAGGRVTGTHGARRRAVRDLYVHEYRKAVGSGLTAVQAADHAAGNAVEALGHSRTRKDHRRWYLGLHW